MTGFSLDWLRLREPFDRAARDPPLTRRFAALLPRPARLVDLGGGSGANLRFLAPRLAPGQSWLVVDDDDALLAAAAADLPPGCAAATLRLDLAGGLDRLDLSACDAVTCSALVDLVSADWLAALVARLAARRRPLLAALTVDGRAAWRPGDPADRLVGEAFARHQRGDKGFGPGLGEGAAPFLAARLAAAGYHVAVAASDWSVAPGERAMLAAMIEGIAGAALSAMPDAAKSIAGWRERRREQAAAGRLALALGHLDVLGWPAD